MNNQESEQLDQFLTQLVEIKLIEKDAAAESLIREAVSRQPDAAYLLVQKCLLQNQALQAAQIQIADLQKQLQQKSASSASNVFLNGDPWSAAAKTEQAVPGASNYKIPATGNLDTARAVPQNPAAGLGSSFLGNVATTAAGVVAGSFLFQGIGNLLGHHQSASSMEHQAANEHEHKTEENVSHHDDNEDDNFHLASDDDSGSFFDDNDSDSDWI